MSPLPPPSCPNQVPVSPKQNKVFPVGENASDTNDLLMCTTCAMATPNTVQT